jgi:hypothetical protein
MFAGEVEPDREETTGQTGSGNAALAIDISMEWAKLEVRLARSWVGKKLGYWLTPADSDEVLSQLFLFWTEVTRGVRGSFKPKGPEATHRDQLQAYVSKMVRNDLLSMLRNSASRSGVTMSIKPAQAKTAATQWACQRVYRQSANLLSAFEEGLEGKSGPNGAINLEALTVDDFDGEFDAYQSRVLADPSDLVEFATAENSRRDETLDLALGFINDVEHAPTALAERMRMRNVKGWPNAAWVCVQVLNKQDAHTALRKAPVMTLRWCHEGYDSPSAIAKVVPRCDTAEQILDTVRREARSVLAEIIERLQLVEHERKRSLDRIVDDAAEAFTKWKGTRGTYAPRTKRKPAYCD